MNKIIFNGYASTDFGLVVDGRNTHNAPERDVTPLEVPGRNGTLTLDGGRWKNCDLTYDAFVYGANWAEKAAAVRAWLLAQTGYHRLEDTYHPDEYRLARFNGTVQWDADCLNRCAKTTLAFTCWPQRFLKSGETALTVTNGQTLTNPTLYPAKPLLRLTVTDTAKLSVGSVQLRITGYSGTLLLDCENQNAYAEGKNLNRYVDAPEFPVLQAGETTIGWEGGISAVEITPRWWSL